MHLCPCMCAHSYWGLLQTLDLDGPDLQKAVLRELFSLEGDALMQSMLNQLIPGPGAAAAGSWRRVMNVPAVTWATEPPVLQQSRTSVDALVPQLTDSNSIPQTASSAGVLWWGIGVAYQLQPLKPDFLIHALVHGVAAARCRFPGCTHRAPR